MSSYTVRSEAKKNRIASTAVETIAMLCLNSTVGFPLFAPDLNQLSTAQRKLLEAFRTRAETNMQLYNNVSNFTLQLHRSQTTFNTTTVTRRMRSPWYKLTSSSQRFLSDNSRHARIRILSLTNHVRYCNCYPSDAQPMVQTDIVFGINVFHQS